MSTNAIDNNHNVSVLQNVIVMDVEELHPAWPTYVINVNPQNPGPFKLVIRIKPQDSTIATKHLRMDPDATMVEERPLKQVKLDLNNTNPVITTPCPVQILNCRINEDMLDEKLRLKPGKYSTNVGYRLSSARRAHAEAVSRYKHQNEDCEKENMSV